MQTRFGENCVLYLYRKWWDELSYILKCSLNSRYVSNNLEFVPRSSKIDIGKNWVHLKILLQWIDCLTPFKYTLAGMIRNIIFWVLGNRSMVNEDFFNENLNEVTIRLNLNLDINANARSNLIKYLVTYKSYLVDALNSTCPK